MTARRWTRGVGPVETALRDLQNVLGREVKFYAVRAVTATTTLLDSDDLLLVDVTAAGYTVNLPPAATHAGRRYTVKKTDASGHSVTLDGNASETIDGATTLAWSTQYLGYTVQCDGTNWFTVP